MPSYKQLTFNERVVISTGIHHGLSKSRIAAMLSRSVSTISREIERNGSAETLYNAIHAHEAARQRRRKQPSKMDDPDLVALVDRAVREDYSPEQLVHSDLKANGYKIAVQTIYNWLHPRWGLYANHLRHGRRRYRKRVAGKSKHKRIRDGRSITERPAIVEKRARFGDWEGDMVVSKGNRHGVAVLLERKSGFMISFKMNSKKAAEFCQGLHRVIRDNPRLKFKTITFDQGMEFSTHRKVEEICSCKVYYAEPNKPQQKGAVENVNGLLRQYFPRGTDFSTISDRQLQEACQRINSRPRKRLGFKSPLDVIPFQTNFALGI